MENLINDDLDPSSSDKLMNLIVNLIMNLIMNPIMMSLMMNLLKIKTVSYNIKSLILYCYHALLGFRNKRIKNEK